MAQAGEAGAEGPEEAEEDDQRYGCGGDSGLTKQPSSQLAGLVDASPDDVLRG